MANKKVIKSIELSLGLDYQPLVKGLDEAENKLRMTQSEIKGLQESLKLEWNPEKFKQAQEAAQRYLEETRKKADLLRDAIRQAVEADAEKVKDDRLSKLNAELEKTKQKAAEVREAMNKMADSNSGDDKKRFTELNSELEKTETKAKSLEKTIKQVGEADASAEKDNHIRYLNKELQYLDNEALKAKKQVEDIDKISLGNTKKQIEESGKALDVTKEKTQLLRERLDMKFDRNTVKELQEASQAAIDKTKEKVERLKALMTEMEQHEFGSTTKEFKEVENQVISLETEIIKLNKDLKDIGNVNLTWLGEKFTSFGTKVENIGKSLLPLSTTATAGLTLAAKAAIDHESAFAGVKKTVEATEEEYAALKKQLIEMSEVIPLTAKELMGIAESAGQLGIEKENILAFTQVMADLGVATNLTGEEASSTLSKFANITQMPQDQFDRLGSTIVALGNNTFSTERDIAAMAMRLAGAGTQANMTEAQILSLAAFLSSVGIEAEAGGSAISRVLMDMQIAVETGKGKLKDFAEVAGMSASQFQRAFKEDAANALFLFVQGLARAKEEGVSAVQILDDMELSNIRINDALLRSSSAAGLFADTMRTGSQAWEENNALTKEAAERYGTTESKLIMTKNALENAAASIGEKLLPYLGMAMDKVKDFAGWLDSLDDGTKEMIVQVGLLTAVIAPLLVGIGNVSQSIGVLFTLIGKHPIGTLITALGLLTAATFALSESTKGVSKEIDKLNKSYDEQIKSLNKTYDQQKNGIKYTDDLIDKYEKLNDEVKNSTDSTEDLTETKKELKSVVDQINRLIPDAIGQINAETGAYDTQAVSIRLLLNEKKKLIEAQYAEQKAIKILGAIDGQKNLRGEAQKELDEVANEYASKFKLSDRDRVAIKLGKYDFTEDRGYALLAMKAQKLAKNISDIDTKIAELQTDYGKEIKNSFIKSEASSQTEETEEQRIERERLERIAAQPDKNSAQTQQTVTNRQNDYWETKDFDLAMKALSSTRKYGSDDQIKDAKKILDYALELNEYEQSEKIKAAQGSAEAIKKIEEDAAEKRLALKIAYYGEETKEGLAARTEYNNQINSLDKKSTSGTSKKKELTDEANAIKEYNERKRTLELQYKAGDIKSKEEYYRELRNLRDDYLTKNSDEWLQAEAELNKQGVEIYNEKKQRLELEYNLLDEEERDKAAHYNALLALQQEYLTEGSDEWIKAQIELNAKKKELEQENIESYKEAVSDKKFESSFKVKIEGLEGMEAVEEYKKQADEIAEYRRLYLDGNIKEHKEAYMQSLMEETDLREKYNTEMVKLYDKDLAALDEKLKKGLIPWEQYYQDIAKLREDYERDYKEKPEENPVDLSGLDAHADEKVYNARRAGIKDKFNDYDYEQDSTGKTTHIERLGQYIQDLKAVYAQSGEFFKTNKEEGKQLWVEIVNATAEYNEIIISTLTDDLKKQLDKGKITFKEFKEQLLAQAEELYGLGSDAYKKIFEMVEKESVSAYSKKKKELDWYRREELISEEEYFKQSLLLIKAYLAEGTEEYDAAMKSFISDQNAYNKRIAAEMEKAAEQSAKEAEQAKKAREEAEKKERDRLEKERQEKVDALAKEKEAELRSAQSAQSQASGAMISAEKETLDAEKAILDERIKNIDAEIKKRRELTQARSEQDAMDNLRKQLSQAEAEYEFARLDEHGDDYDRENKRLEVERLRQDLAKAEENAAEETIIKALEEEKAVLQEQIRTLEDAAADLKTTITDSVAGATEDIRQIAQEWAESQIPPVTQEEITTAVQEALASSVSTSSSGEGETGNVGGGYMYQDANGEWKTAKHTYDDQYASRMREFSAISALQERLNNGTASSLDKARAVSLNITVNANGLNEQQAKSLAIKVVDDKFRKEGL